MMFSGYNNRNIEPKLLREATRYPVIVVTGPRQSGKTMVVQHCFPKKPYYNLEDMELRQNVLEDPRAFLRLNTSGAIIDEIQYCPELVSYMQGFVDDHPNETGLFILTGSQNFSISQTVSQSLAGRVAMCTLLPYALDEVPNIQSNDVDDDMLKGFYPRKIGFDIDTDAYYSDYIMTYVERDIRQIQAVKDLRRFEMFLKLCAGRAGSLLNIQSLSIDAGIDQRTVKDWLSLLQASYVINLLPPYHKNIGKRLIKSPKLYFYDTGLLCYLLAIRTKEQLFRDPMRGHIFENMVIMDMVKVAHNARVRPNFYFFRDNNGNEVDIVFQRGDALVGVEIKSSETYNPDFVKGLKYLDRLKNVATEEGRLVYAGREYPPTSGYEITNYRNIRQWLEPLLKS